MKIFACVGDEMISSFCSGDALFPKMYGFNMGFQFDDVKFITWAKKFYGLSEARFGNDV